MIVYLDSSVLLRLALRQPGGISNLDAIDAAVASGLVELECARTLDRMRLKALLSIEDLVARRTEVERILSGVHLVDVDRTVLVRAAQPLPVALGSLDAIHLATALLWREANRGDISMATHDGALAAAARAVGLDVVGA